MIPQQSLFKSRYRGPFETIPHGRGIDYLEKHLVCRLVWFTDDIEKH